MSTSKEQLVAACFTQDEKTGVYMGFYKNLPEELAQQLSGAGIHHISDGTVSVLTVDSAHADKAATLAAKLAPHSIADNELDAHAPAIFKLVAGSSNNRLTDEEGKAAQSVMAEFAAGLYAAQQQDKASGKPNEQLYKHVAKFQKLLGEDAAAVNLNYALRQILPQAKTAVMTNAIQADATLNNQEKQVAWKLYNAIETAQARGADSAAALDAFAQTDPRTKKVYDEVQKLIKENKDKISAQIKFEGDKVAGASITDDDLFKAVRQHLGNIADAQGRAK